MTTTEDRCRQAMAADDWPTADQLGEQLTAEDEQRRLRGAALWYARRGLPVFPCEPRGKRPLGRLAPNGFQDATLNERHIDLWWTAEPRANVAAPTGVLFDVLDVDGPNGVATLAANDKGLAFLLANSLGAVRTPRDDGWHFYQSPNPARRNRSNVSAGVDVRALGGYVLLPPSITDDHRPGGLYRWVKRPHETLWRPDAVEQVA